MSSNTFIKQSMLKLIQSGILTDTVEKSFSISNKDDTIKPATPPSSDFRQKFLSTPEGPEREKLIYDAVIAQGPPKNLVPVTVSGPNNIKITYYVMPDYIKIGDIRVTMSPATAQKVANHFGMHLPTDKMSKQIYDAADMKVRANPLSGAGYKGLDGRWYTGKEVVNNRIGKSDAAVAYSSLTDQEIDKEKTKSGKEPTLIAGHGKDILQPLDNPNDPRIGGWHGKDKTPIQPYTAAHKGEAGRHSEYSLYSRLSGNKVLITTPDGKTVEKTMDEILNDPILSKSLTIKPGYKKYNT